MNHAILLLASFAAQGTDTTASAVPPDAPAAVLSPAPAPVLPSRLDTVQQEGVQVRGHRSRKGGSVADASVGKIATPLHETPRAVSVLAAEDLRDRGARTVAQTLNMVPGVFTNGTNANEGYHYKARGYHMPPSVYLVDGFQGVRAGGDYSPSLFGIDRVVFLRGPASLTYGAMTVPGGMVNLITKAPQEKEMRRVDVRMGPWSERSVGFGSAASWGVDADASGKLVEDGSLTYRVAGNWENLSGFVADTRDSSRRFLGSVLWKIDDEGRYTLRPIVQWDWTSRRAGNAMTISPTSSLSTKDGQTGIDQDDIASLDVNRYAGGRQDEQFTAGIDAKARPVEGIALSAAYRWLSYDTDVNQWAPDATTLKQLDPADPRSWVVGRKQTKSRTERFNHAFDVNAQWEWSPTEIVKNTATVGFNGRYSGTDRSVSGTGAARSPINIYTGVTTEALRDSALVLTPAFLTETLNSNLYLMDQAALFDNRLVLSGGLAWAWETNDRDYGRTSIKRDTVTNLANILADKSGGPIPTAGVLFQIVPELAVYGAYATSYSLPNGEYEDRSGRTGGFDPTTGVNYEGGFKFDLGRTSATVSVYHVSQKGVLVLSDAKDLNANGKQYYVQSDDDGRESFGVEATVDAEPLPGWTASLVGSWIDAKVKSSVDSVADGSPVDKTPEWSATVYNRYDIRGGALAGLGASATVNWQTERWMATKTTAAPDPLVMPWTTKVDLGLFYKVTPRLEIAANLENVFDELIVEGGSTGSALTLGSPRNLVVRVGYEL